MTINNNNNQNTPPKLTREQWLNATATLICQEIIEPTTQIPRPPFRISVGWPHASKQSHNKILGQCFPREWSQDHHNEIFISPTKGANDSALVLATLTHELIHAYDNCEHGHRQEFKRLATKAGLQGKMTETHPSPQLQAQLQDYIEMFGPIPHAQLDTSKQKRQKGRQLKVECTFTGCGFKFNTSQKQIDRIVNWTCPVCEHDLLQQAPPT